MFDNLSDAGVNHAPTFADSGSPGGVNKGLRCNPEAQKAPGSCVVSQSSPVNRLYFGDNLDWLSKMDADSVDLVYLDPPFNSKAAYNLLYKSPDGEAAQAQYQAFIDSWRWGLPTDAAFAAVIASGSPAAGILTALNNYMQKSDLMAYLVMMTARLIELRRVLKPSGSLFLHCDASASHYLKIIMDEVFDGTFRNEIIWRRSTGKSLMTRRLPTNHDVLLFYAGEGNTWNEDDAFLPYDPLNLPEKTATKYSHKDSDGRVYRLDNLINPNPDRPNLTYEFLGITRVWRWTRERMQQAYKDGLVVQSAPGRVPQFKRYLNEQRGIPLDDVWTDIPPLNSQAQERLHYPTQKPLALLERIIGLASSPGETVLDPFAGCGTAIEAAQRLGRNWIGIDVTVLAIDVVERRLKRMGLQRGVDYKVDGIPLDLDGARRLFAEDYHQFQLWALTLVDGQPRDGGKKGADKGVDGLIYFQDDMRNVGQAIVSVKGGENIHAEHVRDLIGTVHSQRAKFGVFITLHEPTAAMLKAAREADPVEAGGKLRPGIQICTIKQLLSGHKPNLPPVFDIISAASAARRAGSRQPLPPTPDEIRKSPSFKLPITGGKKKPVQESLPMDEPLLVQPQPSKGRGRKKSA
jgi:site-specific DNA-methyltransferase (adenine-specific)